MMPRERADYAVAWHAMPSGVRECFEYALGLERELQARGNVWRELLNVTTFTLCKAAGTMPRWAVALAHTLFMDTDVSGGAGSHYVGGVLVFCAMQSDPTETARAVAAVWRLIGGTALITPRGSGEHAFAKDELDSYLLRLDARAFDLCQLEGYVPAVKDR